MEQFYILDKLVQEIQKFDFKNYYNNDKNQIQQSSIAIIFKFTQNNIKIPSIPKLESISSNLFSEILLRIKEDNILLFKNEQNIFDILFIQRAYNEKDRFSGQIALPGGKSDNNENDYEALKREIFEEIGIDIKKEQNFKFIGKFPINIVHMIHKGKLFYISIHLFFCFQNIAIKIEPSEIIHYKWVPLNDLININEKNIYKYETKIDLIEYFLKSLSDKKTINNLIKNFKSSEYVFIDIGMGEKCWGLTLSLLNYVFGIIKLIIAECNDEEILKLLNKKNIKEGLNFFTFCISYKKTNFKIDNLYFKTWGKIIDLNYKVTHTYFDYNYYCTNKKHENSMLTKHNYEKLFRDLIFKYYTPHL